ncbi:hypothetical protein SAMN02745121_08792 [Nannocystis exedens]|uniref:PQQ-like domain-containing protein n=2 Tax=Nannocystis exedens TaxID=54 RepID=A0A1I2IK77_9BACT|nr:hypothetical protein NAEX_05595 [Nannocystis exedens]SFF42664.1 hypothetical protein SAMN02745121_08792 [Nannocystis exedens]
MLLLCQCNVESPLFVTEGPSGGSTTDATTGGPSDSTSTSTSTSTSDSEATWTDGEPDQPTESGGPGECEGWPEQGFSPLWAPSGESTGEPMPDPVEFACPGARWIYVSTSTTASYSDLAVDSRGHVLIAGPECPGFVVRELDAEGALLDAVIVGPHPETVHHFAGVDAEDSRYIAYVRYSGQPATGIRKYDRDGVLVWERELGAPEPTPVVFAVNSTGDTVLSMISEDDPRTRLIKHDVDGALVFDKELPGATISVLDVDTAGTMAGFDWSSQSGVAKGSAVKLSPDAAVLWSHEPEGVMNRAHARWLAGGDMLFASMFSGTNNSTVGRYTADGTVVWEHPGPQFDINDSVVDLASNGAGELAIGIDWFGEMRVAKVEASGDPGVSHTCATDALASARVTIGADGSLYLLGAANIDGFIRVFVAAFDGS